MNTPKAQHTPRKPTYWTLGKDMIDEDGRIIERITKHGQIRLNARGMRLASARLTQATGN